MIALHAGRLAGGAGFDNSNRNATPREIDRKRQADGLSAGNQDGRVDVQARSPCEPIVRSWPSRVSAGPTGWRALSPETNRLAQNHCRSSRKPDAITVGPDSARASCARQARHYGMAKPCWFGRMFTEAQLERGDRLILPDVSATAAKSRRPRTERPRGVDVACLGDHR